MIQSGIYKITNKINSKSYIGQSVNIHERFGQHKRNAFNENTHTYNYPIYRAIRKYGINNFDFSILEEVEIDNLTRREQYWMDYYDTLNSGYNIQPAENAKRGENSNFHVLKEKQIKSIINLLKSTTISMKNIAEMYSVTGSCIEDINKGKNWKQDNMIYPIRQNAQKIGRRGVCGKVAEQDVLVIRQRYVNEEGLTIYEDYKDKLTWNGFKNILHGVTWKYLPCYKKRLKTWVYPE